MLFIVLFIVMLFILDIATLASRTSLDGAQVLHQSHTLDKKGSQFLVKKGHEVFSSHVLVSAHSLTQQGLIEEVKPEQDM